MKKVQESFVFGFDLENIKRVMEYVKENYKEDVDFKMFIERGDDVMNCLDVFSKKMISDEVLMDLIEECEVC